MRSRKRTAVAALVVVGALGLAGCGDDGDSPVVSSAASNDTGETQDTQDELTEEEQTVGSTREDPFPIGSTVEGTQWAVTINSVTLDADDVVAAADKSNAPAPDGMQYALANVTATYTGADSAAPELTVRYVGADGVTSTAYDPTVVVPGAFDSLAAVSQGGATTGNIMLMVPTDAPETGVLSVEPEKLAATSYVAVQ